MSKYVSNQTIICRFAAANIRGFVEEPVCLSNLRVAVDFNGYTVPTGELAWKRVQSRCEELQRAASTLRARKTLITLTNDLEYPIYQKQLLSQLGCDSLLHFIKLFVASQPAVLRSPSFESPSLHRLVSICEC
jgi:hypothetical protein